jgi:hypothetical protein
MAFEQTAEPESVIARLVACDHFHGPAELSSNARADPLHQLQKPLPVTCLFRLCNEDHVVRVVLHLQ